VTKGPAGFQVYDTPLPGGTEQLFPKIGHIRAEVEKSWNRNLGFIGFRVKIRSMGMDPAGSGRAQIDPTLAGQPSIALKCGMGDRDAQPGGRSIARSERSGPFLDQILRLQRILRPAGGHPVNLFIPFTSVKDLHGLSRANL
jgi:hypothetical protein